MAARKDRNHLDATRAKIQTSQLINRLQKNAKGELELTPVQQRSIEILLRKALPDLSAVEVSGESETRFVIEAPKQAASVAEWLESAQDRAGAANDLEAREDSTKH